MKTIYCYLIAIALSCSLVGCVKPVADLGKGAFESSGSGLSEVAPPQTIQQLKQSLNRYQPQIAIAKPQNDTTIADTTIEVNLTVADFPLFKDDRFSLGPHLDLILDNEFYGELYDLEPIILKDLKPGTHTLRVLAQTPWHESYKNEAAFAQTTFHVLTETDDNHPDPQLPLLTYNQPNGIYSAEPILVDFYLTNVAAEDWIVRATINGESFTIDEWQPIYLEGFKEGNNLIELELLDGNRKSIDNTFNKTIRLITYNEGLNRDTLAQLVTERIPAEEIIATAQKNYFIEPIEEVIEGEIVEEIRIEEPTESSEPIVVEEPTLENEKIILEPKEAETESEIRDKVIEILPPENQEQSSQDLNITITSPEAGDTVPVEIKITPLSNSEIAPIASPEESQETVERTIVLPESKELASIEVELGETSASETTETTKPKLKTPQWLINIKTNVQKFKQRVVTAIQVFSVF